jgi:hypothetical protein
MKLDGEDFNPQDENGAALRPILYDGKIYLPLEALSDFVEKKIEWDENSKTLWLGQTGERVPIGEEIMLSQDKDSAVYYTEVPDLLFLGGSLFKRGLRWKTDHYERYFSFEPIEGKASKFGGVIYLEKGSGYEGKSIVNVVFTSSKDDGGEVLAIFQVTPGKPYPFEFEMRGNKVPVLNTKDDDNPGANYKTKTSNFALFDLYYIK